MRLSNLYGAPVAREQATPALARSFEGATRTKRLAGWNPTQTTFNKDVEHGGKILHARTADLIRNDPLVKRTLIEFVNSLVGVHGIRPVAASPDSRLNDKQDALFKQWATACDARRVGTSGGLSFAGIQRMLATMFWTHGEAPVLRVRTELDGKTPVPVRIRPLHPTQIDSSLMSPLLREGSRTWLGVTLDAGDSVTGYHVKARAVSEDIGARSQHFDVDDLALCFEHLEAGQIRGVSPLAPIVLTLRDLQDAADAERVRMRVAACFSTIIVGEDDDEQDELGPLLTKDGETPVYSMSPAGVYYARGAKDIINPTPQSAGGWKDFDSSHLMRIATGVGLSLDRLSGDLSKSSYSSIRIGDISWRTHVNAFAELFFIPLCLAPIYTWFVTAAVTSGKLPEKALNYAPSWLHPVWQQADTESQYKGAKAKVRCGATSPQRMLAEETGETNWKRIVDETAEFSAYCKQRGVSFETMVEQIAANGQVQSVKGKEPQPTEEPPPAQEPE